MRFALFLAFKYLKPRRSVASVITCVSVLGVMLGTAIVIIVRSVMTGFGDEWERKILDFKPHATVVAAAGHIVYGEYALADRLRRLPGVTGVTPEIDTRVLLKGGTQVLAPILLGVDTEDFQKAYKLGRPYAGTFDLDGDSIVLGRHAARTLGVWVGDEVTVYSPKSLADENEVYLPIKWRVTGIFSTGRHDYDSGYAVASLANVRDLMGLEKGVFAIHVKTDCPVDMLRFKTLVGEIERVAGSGRRILTWREVDREFFNALAVEKNLTAVLLMFISIVAVFCVMITLLVMTVQKTSEIGLLKALGFGRLKIMAVFMIHGMIQCLIGVGLGLLASWAVLSNLQNIVEWLARRGVQVFPGSVYGLDAIPHRVIVSDLVWVIVSVFVFGLLASLVPAASAASKDPVRALNEH